MLERQPIAMRMSVKILWNTGTTFIFTVHLISKFPSIIESNIERVVAVEKIDQICRFP